MAYLKGKKQPDLKSRARVVSDGKKARAWHFKNAAAKARARELYGSAIDDMALRILAIKSGKMDMSLFLPVDLVLATHARIEREAGSPRPPAPSFPVGKNKSIDEFADLVVALAQLNKGKGFRQPSAKPNKWLSTSLVEGVMRQCGRMGKPEFERSKRGLKKQEADAEMKAAILKQRAEGIDPKYLSAHQRRLLEMKEAA